MSKLEDARVKINQIDKEMVKLFEERMKTIQSVAEYKKENHIPILDEKREQNLIEKNVSFLMHKELEEYYRIFFEGVLKSSKEYQQDLIK